jgi:hypothetical protein
MALNEVCQTLVQVADDDVLHQQLLPAKHTFSIMLLLKVSPVIPSNAITPRPQPQLF